MSRPRAAANTLLTADSTCGRVLIYDPSSPLIVEVARGRQGAFPFVSLIGGPDLPTFCEGSFLSISDWANLGIMIFSSPFAFLYMTGAPGPSIKPDHIDGDRTNNRWGKHLSREGARVVAE